MDKLFAALLLIMLWSTVIFAQSTNHSKEIPIEHVDINFPISIHRTNYKQDWTFGSQGNKGYAQYEFKGVYRYIAKESKSRFGRVYRKQLLTTWQESTDNQYGWDNYIKDLDEFRTGGVTYNWWTNRSWLDSLPIEKGGAPTYRTITYGREGDWISIGPLTVTHDLKVRIRSLGIAIDGDQPLQDLERKYLDNKIISNHKTVNVHADQGKSWYNSKLWKFRVKPSINIKPFNNSRISNMVRSAAIKAEIQLFTTKNVNFGNIECAMEYDFQNQTAEVFVVFSLATW